MIKSKNNAIIAQKAPKNGKGIILDQPWPNMQEKHKSEVSNKNFFKSSPISILVLLPTLQ
jgi:hypothetical protein